jgi:hypothetical protein
MDPALRVLCVERQSQGVIEKETLSIGSSLLPEVWVDVTFALVRRAR